MEHEYFKDRISAFLDGELKNEEEQLMAEHLKTCSECQSIYQELQALDALGICAGSPGELVQTGTFNLDGDLPVNPSGGCLGMGNTPQAAGLQRIMEVVIQLRGEAGKRQLLDVETGIAIGSDSEITKAGGAVILSR